VSQVSIEDGAIRVGRHVRISFQRTLRLPDDGRRHPLPPGLGVFTLVAMPPGAADRLGTSEAGDALLPMYQREALWLGFDVPPWRPHAVKVAIGRVNAVSGGPEEEPLRDDPQNYLVCPPQPWLDGVNAADGAVRQFVAMPLGQGYSVESAVAGAERFGGLQITVHEPRPGRFPDEPPPVAAQPFRPAALGAPAGGAMGLGAGGAMTQKIYADPYGLDTWDLEGGRRVVVQIVDSLRFESLTGVPPPPTPVSAASYTAAGLPWFGLDDEEAAHVPSSTVLRRAGTVAEQDRALGVPDALEPLDVPEGQVERLGPRPPERRGRPPPAER
jgi:hypothetical protein